MWCASMPTSPAVSLSRRFAYSAALLAGIAMLVIAATSMWLINQQHTASLTSLLKKEADLQAVTVGDNLHGIAARMSELAKSNLIANALIDDTDKNRVLIPYLNRIRTVQGKQVDILFTDFQGVEIASNSSTNSSTNSGTNSSNGNNKSDVKFTQTELVWLKEKLVVGQAASRVQPGDKGEELVAVEFITLSPTTPVEGALLYKIKLDALGLRSDMRLVRGQESAQLVQSQTSVFATVDVPPIYKNIGFTILANPELAASPSNWPLLGVFLMLAATLVVAVFLLGLSIGKRLTGDLLRLQSFAQSVSEKGFSTGRAEAGNSLEVASLAQSVNRMLDHLRQEHDRLSESEERFRTLFEYSEVGMNVRDKESRYLNVNPAFARMMGYSKEELLGVNFNAITHPDYVEAGMANIKTLLTGQRDHFQMEKKFIRKDGSILWADVTVSAIRDETGNISSFIGVTQDITGRKWTQDDILNLNASLEEQVQQRTAELQASNRDLEEFAYSVAHDLRQPFIAIGGFSGLLERTVEGERAKHYIARIKAGVRQAGELTDALLMLANLSRVQLNLQSVDLSAVVHNIMDALQRETPKRRASISIQAGLVVQADPVLVKLMLQELLGNAWKFTSRQSHTEISFGLVSAPAAAAGSLPVYAVRDNGEGFDMALANKLFRSFQRLHSEPDFPGAGAGLANIQRIVTRHHGRVWAESALGEGASFFFTLGSEPLDNRTLSNRSHY